MDECFQKIAYIGLRNPDGSYMTSVPLYIKVSEVNKNGNTEQEEEIIHRISSLMMKHYDRQIAEHIANLKKGVTNNGQA